MSTISGGWRGSNIVKDGLVFYLNAGSPNSYYPINAGTLWKDISGNKRNVNLINGPVFNSENGGSIVFDGINDLARLSAATNFGAPANLTVSIWVKYTDFVVTDLGRFLFRATTLAENVSFAVYQNTDFPHNKVRAFVVLPSGLIAVSSNTNLNTGQWYFVTMTYNSSALSIYINGVFDISTPGSGNIVWPTPIRTPQLGGSTNSWFRGNIAQSLLYNRALTSAEILQNFNETREIFGV